MIAIAVALFFPVGPLLLGLAGLTQTRRAPADRALEPPPWDWRLTIASALLYTLAFNLTFLVQELFLVLPKAFLPGVRPTLFHNNHTWQGEHPLTSLFQGTGALAIFILGVACALGLRWRAVGSPTVRLFLVWMAYSGLFHALLQIVVGSVSSQSDVGLALHYLELGSTTKTILALAALAVMPFVAMWLTRVLLTFADNPAHVASASGRMRFVCLCATVPALLALIPIVGFRVPREFVEVVVVPAVATVTGVVWMQAVAWCSTGVKRADAAGVVSIVYPAAAVLVLLFVFQVILRPGIAFR
jgi:hypothetical protein